MAGLCETLRGMKFNTAKLLFALVAAVLFVAPASSRAQQDPLGGLKDLQAPGGFTSAQYFEAPNEQKIKMRVSGAEATPLPDTLMAVKQLKLEMFSTNGTPEVVVKAPQCTYAPLSGVASSAGQLELIALGGKLRVAGEGFLWRQGEGTLSISNRVHTTIDINVFAEKKTAL